MTSLQPRVPALRISGTPPSSWADALDSALARGSAGIFLVAGLHSATRAALFDTVISYLDEIRRDDPELAPIWDLGGILAGRAPSFDWIRADDSERNALTPGVVTRLVAVGAGGALLGDLTGRDAASAAVAAAQAGLLVFAGIEADSPTSALTALASLGVSPLTMTVHLEAVLY